MYSETGANFALANLVDRQPGVSPGWPGSSQSPVESHQPLLPLFPATFGLTTWAQAAPDPKVWGGHSMLIPHRAAPHPGHLAAALLCIYGNSREDTEPPGPSRGGYEVPGPGREGCGFSGSPQCTRHRQSSASPLRRPSGRTPRPVWLSDLLPHQPSPVPTCRCRPARWEGETCHKLSLHHRFPPGSKQYSFIQLTFLSPWAELGFGAAKMTQPWSSRRTQGLVG